MINLASYDSSTQIRSLGSNTPIIVTGSSDEETVFEALQQGVHIIPETADYLDCLPLAAERALEAKLAKTKLRQSEVRFQCFVDHCPAIAFLKDEKGHLLYANRRFEEGCGMKNWRGKTDADLWAAETSRQLQANDALVLATTQARQFQEIITTREGLTRHWHTQRFPVLGDDGEVLLGGMAIDVSQQWTVEEALRVSDEQLRQAVKMESLGQLAGGVAHDFNNLLTIILSYSDILLSDGGSGRADDDCALREIQHAAERAATLTRQLLAFSRKQVLEPKMISLNDTVSGIKRMLERLIGEDIEVRANLAPNLQAVVADPAQMEQVLVNLAVNARDAMPNGGQLNIETANFELGLNDPGSHPELEPGRYVMLTMSDNGCGMSAAIKARVFEPFFTTKAAGKGTGLGLATVFGIVKQSNGHISIKSKVGQGTEFRIYLPALTSCDTFAPCGRMSSKSLQGNETILLVEDEEHVRSVGRLALEACGYTVLEASCPLEAIDICQSHPGNIHLLLTDVVMPKLNGHQLAERLRTERPEMEVMYISGHSCDEMIEKGVLNATVSFLQKPFTPSSLAQKVRETLTAAVLSGAECQHLNSSSTLPERYAAAW